MFDHFVNAWLSLVEPYTVEAIVVVLYLTLKEKDLKYVFLLMMLSRFLNALIKSSLPFIPLPNPALEGSAFPSGHMQIASVFYVWLLYKYKSFPIRFLALFVLGCGGYCQIYCGFHFATDIIAAQIISFLIVFSFFQFTKNISDKTKLSLILFVATFSVMLLYKFGLPCYIKDEYLIKTYYKILGFAVAHIILENRKCEGFDYFALGLLCAYFVLLKDAKVYVLNQTYWIPILFSLPLLKNLCFKDITRSKRG